MGGRGGACGAKEEERGSGGRAGGGRSRNCQRYMQAIVVTPP